MRRLLPWHRVFAASRVATVAVAMAVPGLASAQAAVALSALDRQDCDAATDALNKGMADAEPRALYIVGQMFEFGVCLKKNTSRAAPVYERAAQAGDLDAARSLALLNARGDGVPQSYPKAGYWFAVMRHEKKGVETPAVDAYAKPDAVARTYVEAVHTLAEQDLAYPDEAAIQGVQGAVVMHFDPRTDVASVVGSSDNKGSSASHFGPSRHLFEHVLMASYDHAIREMPKPPLPEGVDYATDHRVNFNRDRNNRRLPQGLLDIRR